MIDNQNEKSRLPTKIKNMNGFSLFLKRFFDISSASCLFVVLLPLYFLLSLGVSFTSKGPIIFADKRVGKGGKPINVLKFRTMYIDSETHPEKYLSQAQMKEWEEERKVKNDPRIVPFGRFLRKTSLDELPQLINIVLGTMSVVGPRAITKNELFGNYSEKERQLLLSVRPGLTGYWQVFGRGVSSYASGERAAFELEYFAKRSCLYDLYLIFETIPAVFSHKGAQ